MQPEDLLTPESRTFLRDRIDACAAAAQARFRDAVIPIYGANENGRPEHIGSAVLLKVNGRKVILTAAHVADENKVTTLYAPGRPKSPERLGELIEIKDLFEATKAPQSDRARDRFDFAYCGLSDELSQAIVGRFIDEHEVATSAVVEEGRLYTALGYPNSKNSKHNPLTRSVHPTLLPYSNVHKVDKAVAASLPCGGQRHIFLPYGKRSRSNGQIVNSVQLRGMSGGAVIDSGAAPIPLLAGITIERREKRVLIATRMSTIMPSLQSAFPAA
ncbi:MAG: hypothetical protein ABSF67_00805 [Roseiarcus sp.]|jgi:hypothetical protein